MTAEKKEGLSGLVKCLLDNMPALAFTKDAGNGKYLVCNQRFA